MRVRIQPAMALVAVLLALLNASALPGKEKMSGRVDPNDVTLQLYQLLDDTHGGKLADFYVMADTYQDSSQPGSDFRHVLKVDYDKSRAFGKLRIDVRSVGKMTTEQIKAYDSKQIFDFGESDLERFMKTDPGPLGKPGDMYQKASSDGPLVTAPVSDEARKSYETFVSQHILPALQKK